MTPDSPKGPERATHTWTERSTVAGAMEDAETGIPANCANWQIVSVVLHDEVDRLTAELQAQNRLYRMVGTERDEKQFEIERLRRWVDRFRERAAEHAAEVSRLREQLAAQRPAQHKARVTKLLGSGQSVAVCPGCKEGMTGPDQQAQDWKDQHEADTLRPTLDPMEHDTDAAAAHFIKNAMIAEGRPSGSERLAPQSVVPPAPTQLRDECRALEGATGIECFLPPGHHEWHSGRHEPRTDGTESVGYPMNVQWPRTEWDQCEPEKNVWQRGDREPAIVTAVRGFSTGNVYTRRVEGFGGPWDYETSDGRAWSTWDGLIEEERGAELPDAIPDAAQAARSEATPEEFVPLCSSIYVHSNLWFRCGMTAGHEDDHQFEEPPLCVRWPDSSSERVPSPSLRKEGEDSD